jgi:hypothetical protein
MKIKRQSTLTGDCQTAKILATEQKYIITNIQLTFGTLGETKNEV